MRPSLLLPLLLAILHSPLRSQSLEAEDALLRERLDAGTLTLTRYRTMAEELRATATALGGYPALPVDSAGRYRLEVRIVTEQSIGQLAGSIQRWLALGGFTGADRYAAADAAGMVRYVETPYQFTAQHRELLPSLRPLADASTVGCVMEVTYGDGAITVTWSDPLYVERYEDLTVNLSDGAAAAPREQPYHMTSLLPLVDGDARHFTWKLQRALLIHDCVAGLAGSLQAYLSVPEGQ